MKLNKILAAVLALVLTVAMCATAFADTFKMGIDAEYPPFSYLGDDAEFTGFDVEICKAVCELNGWDFEIFSVNWDEKLIQLDSFECDCIWSGMTILDSMKENGYVISRPYFDNGQVVVVRKDAGIATAADLAGKFVAVQLGTSGEELLRGELADMTATFQNLLTCESFLMCFTELQGNGVDAVFVDKPVAVAFLRENPDYVMLDEIFGNEQYGIAFRNGEDELCAKVEAALDTLVENGTYAAIAAKYAEDIDASCLSLLNAQ